jgi:predicted RecB family nuclease
MPVSAFQLPLIDKEVFINAFICRRLGWFTIHDQDPQKPSDGDLLRMLEGQRIGKAARRLFADGVLVQEPITEHAVATTQRLLADRSVPAIFEATFVAGNFVAKADILIRTLRKWHLIEVKAALGESEDHLRDMAYTAFVLSRAGLPLKQMSLLLINRGYRLGQSDRELFEKPLNKTSDVRELLPTYKAVARRIERAVYSSQAPASRLIKACKGCNHFETDCFGKDTKHHILHLPRITEKAVKKLNRKGIHAIKDVPAKFKLTDSQAIVRRAVIQNRPQHDLEELRNSLDQVRWPAAYLDFETIQTALPRFDGVGPYEQFVTQFSLHVCEEVGQVEDHHEYLADPGRDCRRELVERLIKYTEDAKSIIVYSPYEQTTLKALAAIFPDLKRDIQGCIERLFDLKEALRPETYYHPDFKGSYSIKRILPVLVPGASYGGLPAPTSRRTIA